MKILYVTTVGITMNFFKKLIEGLINRGNSVDVACNDSEYAVDSFYTELGCTVYKLSCTRSPFSVGNIKAIREIQKVVSEGNYDIVHCHTPIAAACTRLACKNMRMGYADKKMKKAVKVIYTAHGFHFYSGAPIKNWIVFYPVERLCATYTDILITINREDYERASNKFNVKRIEYISGTGIDVAKFSGNRLSGEECLKIRESIGVPDGAKVALSVGELNKNKNHEVIIKALAELNARKDAGGLYYIIVGKGSLEQHLRKLSENLVISDYVKFLGFRKDVEKFYQIADIYVHPSFREGLSVSVMEAMASGLPVVGSNVRGIRDLVMDEKLLCSPKSATAFADVLGSMGAEERNKISEVNIARSLNFDFSKINAGMIKLYEEA